MNVKRLLALMVLVALYSPGSWACGDKYLVRCVVNRSDVAPPAHGQLGRIVIINDGATTVKRLIDLALPHELTARGFTVFVVQNREELAEVVADTRLDLAVVDWQQVDAFRPTLGRDTPILPVIDRSSASELPALRQEYAHILKVPGQKSTSLATVDFAVRDARKSL